MIFPFTIIDLTHTLHPGVPTWDDGCGFGQECLHDEDAAPGNDETFRIMGLHMEAGIGTHMDAPAHLYKDGTPIHALPLQDLCMPCVVIDVTHKAHANYTITDDDILTFEDTYQKIDKDMCVVFHTGWARHWEDRKAYHNNHVFPCVGEDAARLLLARGVRALGIDTLSPDRPENDFIVHKLFLGQGKVLLENVANLSSMPAKGAFVLALPLKIQDGTEAPLRLVGLVRQDVDIPSKL